jgi:MFS family permease
MTIDIFPLTFIGKMFDTSFMFSSFNKIPKNLLAWIVWSASAVFLLFQFFLQLSSADIVGGLMESFSLNPLGAGLLASVYYYIYVTLQTPAGILVDRFGPRLLLSLGALVCSIGCWIFATSVHLPWAVVGRMTMGMGAAFAFVGSLSLISRWFPVSRFAIMVAVAETLGMFGAMFGGTLLAHLVLHFGWRASIQGAAILAAGISVLIWLVVRDSPPGTVPLPLPSTDFWSDIKLLVNNRAAWINGIYSGLMFSVQTVFIALWGVQFMQIAHGISLTMAAFVCNLVFVGVCIGGPVIAWIDGRYACRRAVTVGGALATAFIFSLILYLPEIPLVGVCILMVLLGFSCSVYVLTFIIANEVAPSYMRSTSVGFVNMLSVGSAPILQPLAGFFLALSSRHGAHYPLHQYQLALSILPIGLLIAAWLARYLPVIIRKAELETPVLQS